MTAQRSYLRPAIIAVLIIAALALIVFRPQPLRPKAYYIPSEAMVPTLLVGDRLLVNRTAYRSNDGAPAVPPPRGDIATLTTPNGRLTYIKRVIGLPGDRIQLRGGIVILNGKALARQAEDPANIPVDRNQPCDAQQAAYRMILRGRLVCALPRFRETLPNGVSYDTIDLGVGASEGDDYGPITVPGGSVFVMGDNRDQSADSRYPIEDMGLGGPVPLANLDGRAELITYSYDGSGRWFDPRSWFSSVRPGRSRLSLRARHGES